MSSSNSALILLTSMLSLAFIWTQLTPDTTAEQLSVISDQQESLIQANKVLIQRIDTLENNIFELQSSQQQLEERLFDLEYSSSNDPSSQSDQVISKANEEPVELVKPALKSLTLESKLLAASIPLDTIQRIKQRVGENHLARLQLRDQAIREDWIDTAEYIEKAKHTPNPTDGLREEFGDETYDQYLYASGRPNRVIVREVFSGSAAENAGIKSGDIILSYASKLIYSMSELQQATTEGYSDETVLIEIMRDDLPFSTSAPRGPLGISMTIIRKEPK